MVVSLVVAASSEHAIGKDNGLLWKLPNDMKFFKNLTWGMPVIMGRKTFESMRSKPLPGRINIVITRNVNNLSFESNLWFCGSLNEAIAKASATDCMEAFVIGGGEIYRHAMPLANKIYMTRVHGHFPEADVFFPEIDPRVFSRSDAVEMPTDEKHAFPYTFETWERIPAV